MERIIDILNDLAAKLGIRILTPEYEIALSLLDERKLTADRLFNHSSLSSTGFFNAIDRMKHWGILVSEPNPLDKRGKLYSLDQSVAELILSKFGEYLACRATYGDVGLPASELANQKANIVRKGHLAHLTCEYQILLYLHLRPGLSNVECRSLVDLSMTKFNTSVAHLVRMGLIYFIPDMADKRRKLYFISGEVKWLLDEVHERVFRWLDTRVKAAPAHCPAPNAS